MLANRAFHPVQGLDDSDAAVASARSIKVVTYNILADKYIGYHSYCNPKHSAWAWRRPLILSELQRYDADIMCLQEVEDGFYYDSLQPWMAQRGFSSLYRQRGRRRSFRAASALEGVSLHWRSSGFKEVASRQLRFADVAGDVLPATPRTGGCLEKLVCKLDEGAVMALLQHVSTGAHVLACSTHLHWNPAEPDVKVAQAAILCHAVAEFLRQHMGHVDVPTIIAGDLNSLWHKYESDPWDQLPPGAVMTSGVYTLLSTGRLDPSHPDHPAQRMRQRGAAAAGGGAATPSGAAAAAGPSSSGRGAAGRRGSGGGRRPAAAGAGAGAAADVAAEAQALVQHSFSTAGLQLTSAWMAAHGREPALTTRTTTFSGALDYIFTSQAHFNVTQALDLPYSDPAEPSPPSAVPATSLPPMPNAEFPSDHLAMGCVLMLRQPAAAAEAVGWEQG